MKTRVLIIVIAASTSTSIWIDQAYADCNTNIDYNLALKESELAFTGTVTRLDNYDGPQKVTFFIHEVIKGEIDTPKYILENSGLIFLENDGIQSSSSNVDYEIGKTYKVYVENGNTNQCTTQIITPPADYIWEPGPEDGNYYSANPVWVNPCDDGYGLADGVCITIEEMNRNAPPHLEPEPIPEPYHESPIYDPPCGLGTTYQDGICIVNQTENVNSNSSYKWEASYNVISIDETVLCGEGTELIDNQCIPIKAVKANSQPPGSCLIATASYGSELAPQVQMLREVRDNILLSTDSGVLFMEGFNTIYYSFSPEIAQLENNNPIFKEAVKIFITPMVATLSIMTLVDEGSESQVILFGASTIGLIVGMYVVAPIALVWKVGKRK